MWGVGGLGGGKLWYLVLKKYSEIFKLRSWVFFLYCGKLGIRIEYRLFLWKIGIWGVLDEYGDGIYVFNW